MIQFHTLVASDLDGTLLPEGQTELSCAVFDEIRRLHDCGILFCAASGRPLDALRELFAPVLLPTSQIISLRMHPVIRIPSLQLSIQPLICRTLSLSALLRMRAPSWQVRQQLCSPPRPISRMSMKIISSAG